MSDDVKKLLEQAKQTLAAPENKRQFVNQETVFKFLRECGIREGDTPIPTFMVYYLYLDHMKHRVKVKPDKFFKIIKGMFTQVDIKWIRHYMLDAEPFDLTEEGWFKYRRRRHNDEKKIKKRPKSRKKSSTETGVQSKKKS